MSFILNILFGKKADAEELEALRPYLKSELALAGKQTRASETFNSAVAELGMRVLSGEAGGPIRLQMDKAATTYEATMLRVQQLHEHGAIHAPEAAAEFYTAQHLVYGDHLAWARAQQVLYQSQATPAAVETLADADERLHADKRQADKLRAKLVGYMGMSRHDLSEMMREAGAFDA